MIAGDDVEFSESARIRRSILWGQVVIGDNCKVTDSIIMGGPVTIPNGMNLEKSIVTPLVHGKIPASTKILQEQGIMVWPLRQ
jgi:ADP-glucose pyrophosphorylase